MALPTTTLKATRLYRIAGEDAAEFAQGEIGCLTAALESSQGTYTLTASTFQLRQDQFPVTADNGGIDYTVPANVGQRTSGANAEVLAEYLMDASTLAPGTYTAIFTLTASDADGNTLKFVVEGPLFVR